MACIYCPGAFGVMVRYSIGFLPSGQPSAPQPGAAVRTRPDSSSGTAGIAACRRRSPRRAGPTGRSTSTTAARSCGSFPADGAAEFGAAFRCHRWPFRAHRGAARVADDFVVDEPHGDAEGVVAHGDEQGVGCGVHDGCRAVVVAVVADGGEFAADRGFELIQAGGHWLPPIRSANGPSPNAPTSSRMFMMRWRTSVADWPPSNAAP